MDDSVCPCCGYQTFDTKDRGSYDICPICYWEDDPIPMNDPDFISGANTVSLRQAQANFLLFGACKFEMIRHVRKPDKYDKKSPEWRPVD